MIIDFFIPLLSVVVNSELWSYVFIPLISLFFIVTVPVIIRSFFLWRK